jgi:hypothetical protein
MYVATQPLVSLIAGILIFIIPKVVELHCCNLLDSDWDSWASENVARNNCLHTPTPHLKNADA